MARNIKQFQCTEPGVVFSNYNVVQLGIQAPPGTVFQITEGEDIEVGAYGVYELDLRDSSGFINSLSIERIGPEKSQEATALEEVEEENTQYVLVDIIYET